MEKCILYMDKQFYNERSNYRSGSGSGIVIVLKLTVQILFAELCCVIQTSEMFGKIWNIRADQDMSRIQDRFTQYACALQYTFST